MGRKRGKGQKQSDTQAGGDTAANVPGTSGSSHDGKQGPSSQEPPSQHQAQAVEQVEGQQQGAWQTKSKQRLSENNNVQQSGPQGRGQQQQQGQEQQQSARQERGQQGPSQGRGQQGPPQGRGQQGPPQGRGQQGPPQGRGQQGPSQGRGQQGPPQGRGQQGPPQGRGRHQQQDIPPGKRQQQQPQQQQGAPPVWGQRQPQQQQSQQGAPPAWGQRQPQQQQSPQYTQGQEPRGQQPQQGAPPAWGQRQLQQQQPPQYTQGQEPRGQQPQQGAPPAWGQRQPQQQQSPQHTQGQERGGKYQQGAQQGRGQQQIPQEIQSQDPHPQQRGSGQKGRQQPAAQQRTSPQDSRSPQQSQGAVARFQPPVQEMQALSTFQATGGTKGKPIQVETNYLSIDFGKLRKAYHYDIQIDPDKPKNIQREVFERFRKIHFPDSHPAFDGRRNMYSPKELLPPNRVISEVIEIDIPNDTKKKTFKVNVQFATEIDLSPLHNMRVVNCQQALQCVEIVLRSAPAMKCISVGRSFYTPPSSVIPLGDCAEMYYGFYQTVVRGWKPFFNIDVAHKAFPRPMNVIQVISEMGSDYRRALTEEDMKREPLHESVLTKVAKHMKRLRVIYEIPGSKREYTVNGLDTPPKFKKFTVDNREMTIEEYFLKKKNIRLNFPLMPSLWVGSLTRKDKILLPAEFCTVLPNQAVNRKMTDNQTAAMIKKSATSTVERKQKIMDSLAKARHNEDNTVKEFGFRINSDFEKIQARVLNPPQLEYSKGVVTRPSRGQWRQDTQQFFIGAEAASWVIISLCGNMQRECDNLAKMISNQGNKLGMRINSKPGPFDCVVKWSPTVKDVKGILEKHSKIYNIIFVIIPDSGPVYAYVKKEAELNFNCLTQCIKKTTLAKRMNPATVGNILLKVNSKLSGTNHCLKDKPPILNEPCMIMGADVTHPSPDSTNIPSVVAVTASHDPKAMFGYNMCCRLQLPKVEIIEDLENITREHLIYFYKMNRGQKPYRIIFFRDGVSEGQFEEVKQKELAAIRRACTKLEAAYEPKITFVVVQKRHHTRFFPNSRDSEDKNINVPAGTCVDTIITSPNQQDFYLVSHASIQGVAKPTKYSTIWDDNDLSYDDIEQLAYYLCHLFSRCNRSVSYPAPTYYAHLGAARAKVYIENETIDFSNLQHEQRKLDNEVIRKSKPMFFV